VLQLCLQTDFATGIAFARKCENTAMLYVVSHSTTIFALHSRRSFFKTSWLGQQKVKENVSPFVSAINKFLTRKSIKRLVQQCGVICRSKRILVFKSPACATFLAKFCTTITR